MVNSSTLCVIGVGPVGRGFVGGRGRTKSEVRARSARFRTALAFGRRAFLDRTFLTVRFRRCAFETEGRARDRNRKTKKNKKHEKKIPKKTSKQTKKKNPPPQKKNKKIHKKHNPSPKIIKKFLPPQTPPPHPPPPHTPPPQPPPKTKKFC